ncbi:MAG TPA: ATP-binding protein [Candidatus Binatia bacterium]|nr:ATP-binding protein [Candidatus Binatia bacterium]
MGNRTETVSSPVSPAASRISIVRIAWALIPLSLLLGGVLASHIGFSADWTPASFSVIARLSVFLAFLFAIWWRAPWPATASILGLLYVLGGGAVAPVSSPALATMAIALVTGTMLDRLRKAHAEAASNAAGDDSWLAALTGRREAELEQEIQRLCTHNRELISRNRDLEDFTYTASHDLKSPLRAIRGFGQALLEEYSPVLDGRAGNYVRRMQAAASRLEHTVDALLELARVAQCPLVRTEVDVARLARETVAELAAAHPERKVELRVPDTLIVEGDPALLQIAISNVIGNAWKFTRTREQACIEIGRSQTSKGSAVYVRDNGVGFAAERSALIFRPFERLHSVHEFEGSGIGLATVERIVARHGGIIWAEAAPARGAAFFLIL